MVSLIIALLLQLGYITDASEYIPSIHDGEVSSLIVDDVFMI